MALILNIDCATDTASVGVSNNGRLLAFKESLNQKEHASFVHSAVREVLGKCSLSLKEIEAFAVTSGPGSYTGLRVGMATAKGFCYAFAKPLIAINTLEVMATAAIEAAKDKAVDFLYCPLIDARRMEVFTAVYNSGLQSLLLPQPVILDEEFLKDYLKNNQVMLFGNGSNKLKQILKDDNAIFSDIKYNTSHLGFMANKAFNENRFSDVSYSEPEYLKNFFTVAK